MLRQHPEIVSEISKRIQLIYQEINEAEGNVCFRQSEEVRPEFREIFTAADVAHYLTGVFNKSIATEIENKNFHLSFPYPKNASTFWLGVEKGKV